MSDGNGRPKTYEAVREQRAREWAEKQRAVGARILALHKQHAEMPDVKYAPQPGEVRDFGVVCPQCESKMLENRLWNTINGVRHRFEARCPACSITATYDWSEKRWLDYPPDDLQPLRKLIHDTFRAANVEATDVGPE